jgi:hypothetical protein
MVLRATSFAGTRVCNGDFFGVVGGHVTDQMSFASLRPTQSPPTTRLRTMTGAVTTTCEVPVPPAPSPSLSFANNRERRGDDEEEERGSVVIGHHGPTWMSDGRMGEGIGASLTSRLLSRVGQNLVGRGEVE